MRICLVSQEYPPETANGGIATQTQLKARGLAALGHEVHVLSHSVDGNRHEVRDGTVRVVRIAGPEQRLPVRTEIGRWVTHSDDVAVALAALSAVHRFDLLDFPDYGAEGFIHLLGRERRARPRVVVHVHGSLGMLAEGLGWPERESELYRVGTVMEETCIRLADAVFASSAYSARWCAKGLAIPSERVPVLHAGVDTTVFHPRPNLRSARPTVAFVGRVARSKGADILARAALDVVADVPDLLVRFVGRSEGNLVGELTALAEVAGRRELFQFEGALARDRLVEVLATAHLFAAPSPWEAGPGLVYLEAMASGLPAIACSGSGAAESIRDGVDGLLVPPGDSRSLAEALRTLFRDRVALATMGERARQRILDEADTAHCVRRISEFYETVVAGR